MSKPNSIRGFADLPKWQIALCLLLAMLVVYNPFQAGLDWSASFCVRHSASNRATVGASELQHFTPADWRSVLAGATVAILQHFTVVLPQAPQRRERRSVAAGNPIQFLSASLWFRPPPAV